MSGNVAEMIANENVAIGGSFRSTGNEIRIQSEMNFVSPALDVGFRPIFTFVFE